MALQASQVNKTYPFILGGTALVKENETLLQDAARTVVLDQYTVMAQIAASKKWVPWLNANLGATDGKQTPKGILMNDGGISAASLAAGDVTGAVILVGTGAEVDAGQLVFDKGSTGGGTANTLDSVPTVPTNQALRGEDLLNAFGIYPKTAFVASRAEN